MRKVILMAGAVALVGSANAALLDNFTTPGGNSINGGSWTGVNVGGGIIGGERDYKMTVLANPLGQFVDVSFGGGLSVVSDGFWTQSNLDLQYDGAGDATAGFNAAGNINNVGAGTLAGAFDGDRVRVWFLGNDLAVTVKAETRIGGVVTATNTAIRPAMAGVGFLDIALNAPALAAADSVTVSFLSEPSGDYAISSIETVPEPATMIALGAGLVAIARRRKNA